MTPLRIATRGSALAVAQTDLVVQMLRKSQPQLAIEIVTIVAKGDQNTDDPLWKLEGVGFFTSRLEQVLLDDKADIAVHSFKDLPTTETPGLTIAAVPIRENPADCVVARLKIGSMIRVPAGTFVGTSSLRRQAQLLKLRADLNIQPIRGNVETRLRKLDEGKYDMLVMAAAGLIRLGLQNRIAFMLEPSEFLPAPAQGALAIQARTDDTQTINLVRKLDDADTRRMVSAERWVLKCLHPGCHAPVGVYADKRDNTLHLSAFVSHPDGSEYLRKDIAGAFSQSETLADTLAKEMIESGAKEILEGN
jgi:hydroxymethylbilane synthase